VLIETDDSLDSINATASSIVKYISQKAGIGIGAGRIRAINSPIRGGNAVHTGVLPFYRHFQTAVKSCSQGGVRGGAATLYVPLWHLEIEDILVLKNNKGTEETRLRQLDYGIQFNKVMYERLLCGGNITLFSPHDVPDLYDAFFTNTDEFRRLYEKYESNKKIRKETIKAIDLFMAFMQERKDTGRIYAMNVDHCNDHGSFVKEVAPIRMSNLCLTGDAWITIECENGELQDLTLREYVEKIYGTQETKVLARKINPGKDVYSPVLNAAITGTNKKVLKISDQKTGKFILCTPEHKIYTKNRGYVMAKDLLETDELQLLE
jgi:ribonucleoside-diphosphate reductase alpha chain